VIAIAAGTFVLSIAARAAVSGPPEYDHGYNDCLAGRYDEAQNSRSYRQGCRAAEDERGMDGRPRHWRSMVGIPNVNGMEPFQALTAMASRGYRNVGTLVVRGMIVGIYFNPATGECVQLASANNRVVDARDIGTNPRCRWRL
jgi:anti-sigma factor RsiW